MIGFVKKGSKYVFVANNPKNAAEAVAQVALKELASNFDGTNSSVFPFFWQNGRNKWTPTQANKIINDMGAVEFLKSLGDNNGGQTYKYAQTLIESLESGRNYISFPIESHMAALKKMKWAGSLDFVAPFQPAEEKVYTRFTFKSGKMKREDLTYEEYSA